MRFWIWSLVILWALGFSRWCSADTIVGSTGYHRGTGGVGGVQIVKPNGTVQRYAPASDTAAARGAILLGALARAVAGDEVRVGPGVFALSTSAPTIAAGVHIRTAGQATTITGTYAARVQNFDQASRWCPLPHYLAYGCNYDYSEHRLTGDFAAYTWASGDRAHIVAGTPDGETGPVANTLVAISAATSTYLTLSAHPTWATKDVTNSSIEVWIARDTTERYFDFDCRGFQAGALDPLISVWCPGQGIEEPAAYIDTIGSIYTRASLLVSNRDNGLTGRLNRILPPTSEGYMVGVEADVEGPCIVTRAADTGNYRLFQGCNGAGYYTSSLWPDGSLRWGPGTAATPALEDVRLYRPAAGVLKITDTAGTGGKLQIGPQTLITGATDTEKLTALLNALAAKGLVLNGKPATYTLNADSTATGLLAAWTLDEGTGDPTDKSGNAYHLTLGTGWSWTTGAHGAQLTSTGGGGDTCCVIAAPDAVLKELGASGAAWTVVAWAQADAVAGDKNVMGWTGGSAREICPYYTGNLVTWWGDSPSLWHTAANGYANTGLHQFAWVNESATSHKLYIDAGAPATSTTNLSTATANTSVSFGGNGTGHVYVGSLSTVYVWNRALTAAELTNLVADPWRMWR